LFPLACTPPIPLQAEKFRAKAQVGEGWRCPQQYARYLFYLGTIRAVGLAYTEAKEVLGQAVRKAPGSAAGFVVAASKWLILVRGRGRLLQCMPSRRG
jgi:hypothetical protein